MISYTGLRYIASYASGGLAFILSAAAFWCFTSWMIEEVIIASIFVFLAVGAAMWEITEPEKETPDKNWTPDCVPFYTIKKEEKDEQ